MEARDLNEMCINGEANESQFLYENSIVIRTNSYIDGRTKIVIQRLITDLGEKFHKKFKVEIYQNWGIAIRINHNKQKETILYRDGKLYDSNYNQYLSGIGYKKNGKVRDYLASIYNALEKIRKTKKGKEMLDFLTDRAYQTGSNSLVITSNSNEFSHLGSKPPTISGTGNFYFVATKLNFPTIYVYVAGKEPETKDYIVTLEGTQTPPFYIALAHELAHAWDRIRGTFDFSKVNEEGLEFTESERFSTYIENIIRNENNLPLREYYAMIETTSTASLAAGMGNIKTKVFKVFDKTIYKHIKEIKDTKEIYYDYNFKK